MAFATEVYILPVGGIITDLSYSTDDDKTAVTRNGERITENDV